MECERCGEPNRISARWCRLCGHILGSEVEALPPLASLSASELAQVKRAVEEQTPSPAVLILATLLLGWTGVPRTLLGQGETGFALTLAGIVLALGAIALRIGEHEAAAVPVVALAALWMVNSLSLPRAYSRAIAHTRRAALLKITSDGQGASGGRERGQPGRRS